jgi:hypothetical protein
MMPICPRSGEKGIPTVGPDQRLGTLLGYSPEEQQDGTRLLG